MMPNDERLKKLKQLKHMLENHKKLFTDVQFDMKSWCYIADTPRLRDDPRYRAFGNKIPARCGTAACALGSAGLYKPFMKLGLRSIHGSVHYAGYNSFDAGVKFFGLTWEEAHYLFNPIKYGLQSHDDALSIKPAQVVERVQELIDKYTPKVPKIKPLMPKKKKLKTIDF